MRSKFATFALASCVRSKALGQDGNPSFETIRSILTAMGLRSVEPAEAAKWILGNSVSAARH
jgi:hypothetical protein